MVYCVCSRKEGEDLQTLISEEYNRLLGYECKGPPDPPDHGMQQLSSPGTGPTNSS